jgi:hypothetical protein
MLLELQLSYEVRQRQENRNRVLRLPLAAISNSKSCPGQAYKRMCELNPFSSDSPAFAALHKLFGTIKFLI